MATKQFGGTALLLRFLVGLVLVFASYNPEEWSYWHWALANLPDFSVLKAFVGVVLLIGWTIYLRATVRSLGPFGLILAVAFFGTLIWLLVDTGILPADSVRAVSYIVLVIISGVLAVGVSWSHVRRRLTGQIDVDEIEED